MAAVDLDALLEQAEGSFESADLPGFEKAVAQVDKAIPCLSEPVSVGRAARVHRVMGLGQFTAQVPEAAAQAFAAARKADPTYDWPEILVPPGNPVLAVYTSQDLRKATWEPFPRLGSASWIVDGRGTSRRPTSWPAVVQVVRKDGTVDVSTYAWPDDVLPAVDPSLLAAETAAPTGPNRPLLYVAGGATLASATLLMVSRVAWFNYWDPETPYADLPGLRARTNTCTVSGAVVGGVAVTAAAGAFWVGRW